MVKFHESHQVEVVTQVAERLNHLIDMHPLGILGLSAVVIQNPHLTSRP
jgi:hypothetical protein